MKKLIIYGSNGFALEVAWTAEAMNNSTSSEEKWEVLGFINLESKKSSQQMDGHPIFSNIDTVISKIKEQEIWYSCALFENKERKSSAEIMEKHGFKPAKIIHPTVLISNSARIEEGTYVGAYSIINPGVRIGKHVLINQRVAIGYNVVMEDYSHACPGAQINGNCKIETGAMIGSNASILQNRIIGSYATVGSNSHVVTNVKRNCSVTGVPARIISR